MAIEGAAHLVFGALDQGFADRISSEFVRLCGFPEPVTKLPDFLMEVQKAADTWKLVRDAIEQEIGG